MFLLLLLLLLVVVVVAGVSRGRNATVPIPVLVLVVRVRRQLARLPATLHRREDHPSLVRGRREHSSLLLRPVQRRPVPPAHPRALDDLVPKLDDLLFQLADENARALASLVSRRGKFRALVDQRHVVALLEVPRRGRDGTRDLVRHQALARQLTRLGQSGAEALDERLARSFAGGIRRRLVGD